MKLPPPAQKPNWKYIELANDKLAAAGVVSHLQAIGEWDKATDIALCAGKVEKMFNDGKTTYKFITCHKHKLCPTCSKIRAYKIEKNINEKIAISRVESEGLHSKHLVLTIKDTKQMNRSFCEMAGHKNGTTKDKRHKGYKTLLGELRREGKNSEWYNVSSAFGSIECSISPWDQYHVHLHLVTYSYLPLDVNALETEWQKIAGDDAEVLDNTIDDTDHRQNITSYINKLPALPDVKDRVKWDQVTHGKNMFFTWGELRKAKVPPKKKYVHGFNPTPNAKYEVVRYADGKYTNDYDDVEYQPNMDDSDIPDFPEFIEWES
jgi:hypothetical protein